MMTFINYMLPLIREHKPNAKLAFLAYGDTWKRPNKVKPLTGVFLELAPVHRCFSHAITDSNCQINQENIFLVIEGFLESFNPKDAQVLGYWLDSSLFGRGRLRELQGRLPQFAHIIKEDFQYYLKKGIRAIKTFVVGLDREYFSRYISPTVFLYPMLLWNHQLDLELEIRNFCENYFGDASLSVLFDLRERLDPRDTDKALLKNRIDEINSTIGTLQRSINEKPFQSS